MRLDDKPDAEGVVHPNRDNLAIPDDARCQETLDMIANRYLRCDQPATAIVDFYGREIYWMCEEHASHSVRNRGGTLLMTKEKQ